MCVCVESPKTHLMEPVLFTGRALTEQKGDLHGQEELLAARCGMRRFSRGHGVDVPPDHSHCCLQPSNYITLLRPQSKERR